MRTKHRCSRLAPALLILLSGLVVPFAEEADRPGLFAVTVRQLPTTLAKSVSHVAISKVETRFEIGDVPLPIERPLDELEGWDITGLDFVGQTPSGKYIVIAGEFDLNGSQRYGAMMLPISHPEKASFWTQSGVTAIRTLSTEDTYEIGAMLHANTDHPPQMLCIDPSTSLSRNVSLSEWNFVASDERIHVGSVVAIARPGMEQTPYPFVPPKDMLAETVAMALLRNDAKRVLLQRTSPATTDKKLHYFEYFKKTEAWKEYTAKGDASRSVVVMPWLCTRVGWTYPESDRFGPKFTGEWIFRNLETGSSDSFPFLLNAKSDLLASDTDMLYVRVRSALYEVPRRGDEFADRPERDWRTVVINEEMDNLRMLFWTAPASPKPVR